MFLETYRMTGTSNDDKGKGLNPADDDTTKDSTSKKVIDTTVGVKRQFPVVQEATIVASGSLQS